MPRLRVLTSPKVDPIVAALRSLAIVLDPFLRELHEVERRDVDLVDVVATVPGPRRSIMRACREGRIAGAVRVGRRWLAPRAAVDAWLRSMGPRIVKRGAGDSDDDDLERVLQSLMAPAKRSARAR